MGRYHCRSGCSRWQKNSPEVFRRGNERWIESGTIQTRSLLHRDQENRCHLQPRVHQAERCLHAASVLQILALPIDDLLWARLHRQRTQEDPSSPGAREGGEIVAGPLENHDQQHGLRRPTRKSRLAKAACNVHQRQIKTKVILMLKL